MLKKLFVSGMYIPVMVLTVFFFSCQANDDGTVEKNVKEGVSVIDRNIAVSVEKGVVTLSGSVKDSSTRSAAENAIKESKGVKSVVNHISVQ